MLHQWGEMVTVEQCLSGSHLTAKVLIDIVIPLALTVTKKGDKYPDQR